ncbi:MAG: hypothetical protein EP343_31595 [Deltaproteobacteria bacterium]|nr:MAG: hypothetical protein EP343_31595 [Deltaproteobacteria bacterium]
MARRLYKSLFLGLAVCVTAPLSTTWSAPASRPSPRTQPNARKAPEARKAPVARPTPARKAPAARKAPTQSAPAARTAPARRTAPAPAARKAAEVRKAPARPAPARRADAPKALKAAPQEQVGNPVSNVSNTYHMYFRHEKVGEFTRTEKVLSNQTVEVVNNSEMNIKMIFTTVKALNKSKCLYDKQGRLVEFTITSKVRSRTTKFSGKRTAEGMTITRTQGKKTKTQFFPEGSFQGTSLDNRFPAARPGVQIRRNYLIIPRMAIVEQKLTYREAQPRKVFGTVQSVLELQIESGDAKHRNRGTVLVTKEGKMVASRMMGRLGVVEIRLQN